MRRQTSSDIELTSETHAGAAPKAHSRTHSHRASDDSGARGTGKAAPKPKNEGPQTPTVPQTPSIPISKSSIVSRAPSIDDLTPLVAYMDAKEALTDKIAHSTRRRPTTVADLKPLALSTMQDVMIWGDTDNRRAAADSILDRNEDTTKKVAAQKSLSLNFNMEAGSDALSGLADLFSRGPATVEVASAEVAPLPALPATLADSPPKEQHEPE